MLLLSAFVTLVSISLRYKFNEAITCREIVIFDGRGERIRTSGLYVPNVALYQAKLHPDDQCISR